MHPFNTVCTDHPVSDQLYESLNRRALLRARKQMLSRVPCLTADELAAEVPSSSVPGQLAKALRTAGKAFGVHDGRRWRYPRFQFDSHGNPFPEMSEDLAALIGDEQGWDRLQWFLEPHSAVGGGTPLERWERGQRADVVEAARRERWQGRD
jgi:hypothetical protein